MSKTVSLDPPEWKTLALTGVQQLGAFYSSIPEAPSAENLQQIAAQLDRMLAFARAWHLSLRPAVVVAQQQQRASEPVPQDVHPADRLSLQAYRKASQALKEATINQPPSDIPGERRNKGGRPKGSKNKPKVRQVRNGVGAQT